MCLDTHSFGAFSVVRSQCVRKGEVMDKLNNFFAEYSLGFGVIGLGVAFNDLGISSIAGTGFIVSFISIWSILMAILRAVTEEKI